jgi:predicted 3-demethylubiquinone-9 3-methyltransferase (glyoxalase superfamily)
MNPLTHPITPCCWYNGTAAKAAELYCSAIPGSRITQAGGVMTAMSLGGQSFLALDGGPMYAPNPSISFFATCDTPEETDRVFAALSAGGTVMMPPAKYPWAERFAWCADAFGVSWQVGCGYASPLAKGATPALMFTQKVVGKAEEAMGFYTRTIPGSTIKVIHRYEPGEPGAVGTIKHAQFSLGGRTFVAMDGSPDHPFAFSEGVSLVLHCSTQEEIDHYWGILTEGGSESRCGWLKDKYGVSWQVVPTVLAELLKDPERAPRVVQAFLAMTKFDIAALLRA